MNQKLMMRSSAKEEIIWVVDGNLGESSREQYSDSMRKYFNSECGLKRCALIVDETMQTGVMNTKNN